MILTRGLTRLSSVRTMEARPTRGGTRRGGRVESTRSDPRSRGRPRGIRAPMMTPPLDPDALRSALESAGWRCTPQRLAVYGHLCRAEHHPTAEEVYQGVKLVVPKISLATVYKALEALVASGLAAKLTAGDGSARYDARSEHHYHLRCLRSGARAGPAHSLRPRPDRQARPGPGRRPERAGFGSRAIVWSWSATYDPDAAGAGSIPRMTTRLVRHARAPGRSPPRAATWRRGAGSGARRASSR